MKQKRVLVLSDVNIDFVQRMRRMPYSGETVVEKDLKYTYVPGGSGAISAITFSRFGADCILGAKVGHDQNARRLLTYFKKEGIDTRYVAESADGSTGLSSVLVEENGKNRVIHYPGSNMAFTAEDAEACFTSYPDAVYLTFGIPDEAVFEAAHRAARAEIPLFVDASPARLDFPLKELGKAEILTLNETEIRVFTGITPATEDGCLRAAIRLASQLDVEYIVIKRGERGSFIYDGLEYYAVPAEEVPVTDETGVGDIFSAVMTYVYLQNQNIVSAVKYATCAAAISVMREGTVSGIPSLAEVIAYAKQKVGAADEGDGV